jgi:hypothetical protein
MAKSKRPNRVHGRNKVDQLDKIKQDQDQQHQDRIDAQKKAGTFQGPSMFAIVTKHKTIAYSSLTVIAVLAFVIGPAYFAAVQGGPNQGEFRGDGTTLAKWTTANGDYSVTNTELINLQTRSQELQQFIATLTQNALQNDRGIDFTALDPLSVGFQPIHPIDLSFLSSIANQYNMGVSTEQADAYLQNIAEKNTPEQIKAAQETSIGDSASKRRTLELLAKIISAKRLAQMSGLGVPQVPSISDRWASYKLLTDQHQFEILTVAVDASKVTGEPSPDELKDLLASSREDITDDSGLTPTIGRRIDDATYRNGGARTPTKYQYQFLAINHKAFEALATKQIENYISLNEDVLHEYYLKNIETYPAPEKTLDDINTQAEGEPDEGAETEGDKEDVADKEDANDEGDAADKDESKKETTDESSKENGADPAKPAAKPESDDGCVTQDATEEPIETPAASEKPNADNPAEGETVTPEDLSGLDTPIPLEPNVDPASFVDPNSPAPFIAQPFDEVHDKVRDDYIRTNVPTRVHALIDVELQVIKLRVAAYADAKYGGTSKTNFETIYDAINQSQSTVSNGFVEAADKHMASIAVEINDKLGKEYNKSPPVTENSESTPATTSDDCDDVETDTAEDGDDSDVPTTAQIDEDIAPTVFVEFHRSPLISAIHGPMISQRNPSSNSFGYEQPIADNAYGGFNEHSVSWHKLVRTAYNVHNQPGTPPPTQTLFTTSRFFEVQEKESGEFGPTYTYVYWQINETLSTSFDEITLENPEVKANLIAGWQLDEAKKKAIEDANALVEHYTKNGDNAISLSTLAKDGDELFTTTPTSVLRAQTTGGFGGGMQMVPEANFIYKELTAEQVSENITITEEQQKHVERQIPDIYEPNGNAPSEAIRIFTKLTVGGSPVIISDSTNRHVYIVRKIKVSEPPVTDPPTENSIEGFGTLIQYVRSGTLGGGAFSQFMNAGATDTMYRGTRQAPGSGTIGIISNAFMSYLQKDHGFESVSP